MAETSSNSDKIVGNDTNASTETPDVKAQADKLVAEGKKAIALKDWEAGVEKYAGALDLM